MTYVLRGRGRGKGKGRAAAAAAVQLPGKRTLLKGATTGGVQEGMPTEFKGRRLGMWERSERGGGARERGGGGGGE